MDDFGNARFELQGMAVLLLDGLRALDEPRYTNDPRIQDAIEKISMVLGLAGTVGVRIERLQAEALQLAGQRG